MPTPTRCTLPLLLAVTLAFLPACGTDFEYVLYQAATAAGQTVLDRIITDVANQAAEACEGPDEQPGDGNDNANGNDNTNGNDNGGGDGFDGLVGDPVAGEPLYASCVTCHCDDASGGCVPGAPPVAGASPELLDEYLRGDQPHVAADLTDQEIVDMSAYLATFDGGDGGEPPTDGLVGDPAAGEQLYASCAACHCADASGGCLPGATPLIGVDAETLDAILRGDESHTGGKADLTDQEIADLEALLGSL